MLKRETVLEKRNKIEEQKSILLQEFSSWKLLSLLLDGDCCEKSQSKSNSNAHTLELSFISQLRVSARFSAFCEQIPEYRKASTIIRWLESVERFHSKNDAKKNFLLHKPQLFWLDTFGKFDESSQLISQFDPDAPFRECASLSRSDQKEEEKLLASVYKHLRAGQLELAVQLCEDARQSWRAATLRAQLYADPKVDIVEKEEEESVLEWNKNVRALRDLSGGSAPTGMGVGEMELWRKACKKLAESTSHYEKATYAVLARDLSELRNSGVLCGNFFDSLWSNYKCHPLLDPIFVSSLPASSALQPAHFFSNEDLLSQIPLIEDEKLGLEFSYVQMCLLTWDISSLLKHLSKFRSKDTHRPLAKFVSNLVLVLREICSLKNEEFDFKECVQKVVSEYVEQLLSHNQVPLVPLYCSQLDEKSATNFYAKFLSNNMDSKVSNHELLDLAKRAGLRPALISDKLVALTSKKETVFSTSATADLDVQEERSENAEKLLQAVEWLWREISEQNKISNESEQDYQAAMYQTNLVARGLLLEEPPRFFEVVRLLNLVPEFVREDIERKAKEENETENIAEVPSLELECWTYLLLCGIFASFKEWLKESSQHLCLSMEDPFYKVLAPFECFPKYDSSRPKGDRKNELAEIRKKMVPRIFFTLLRMYDWCVHDAEKNGLCPEKGVEGVKSQHSSCLFLDRFFTVTDAIVNREWVVSQFDVKTQLKPILREIENASLKILRNGHFDPLEVLVSEGNKACYSK